MFSDDYQKPKNKLDQKQAKLKAADFCAYQERSQQEVRDKLYSYGLHKDAVEEVIGELITEDFINEERFALAYAGGKFRIKKWGKRKILEGLKFHRISDYCIKKAFAQIDEEEYFETAKLLLIKKFNSSKATDNYPLNQKMVRFMLQKGYEQGLIWSILREGE